MNPYYTDYSEYLSRFYGDCKVQKISVNTGQGCPNRDGTIGTGGCIYCNNASFTPAYCFANDGLQKQIEEGKRFFARKYPDMKYLVYFQSFTGTYGKSGEELESAWRTALEAEDVVGLVVGTRPDCLPEDTVAALASVARDYPVFVELGIESMHDRTLRLINRGHDSACSRDAIERLARAGLHVGVHLIAGLPGESGEDFLDTLRRICALPVESVKMHHLQVLRGTKLERMWLDGTAGVTVFTPEEYLDLCVKALEVIPRGVAVERFLASAPPAMVAAPRWGLKNYQFTNLLHNRLQREHAAQTANKA